MKTKPILFSILFSFSFYLLSSQTPQGFNYQAIARDASGNPIPNVSLQVKLAVMADSLGTTIYWEELFTPVTTNAYGLFTVILGRGTRQATSTVAAFQNINWKVTPIFLRTQIYYPAAWKNMGTTRLWSVPYALQSNNALTANDVTGTLSKLTVAGKTQAMDTALFEVKNNNGQTIFAVYNEGVRIYVDDGIAKGAVKGGFAIGGFGTAKGVSQEYFRVTRDSTRIYVNELAKGATKGGFAIGGFSPAKGADTSSYMTLSPLNYYIGYGAGKSYSTGQYNSFMGYHAGMNNDGSYNTFIGYKTGTANTTGSQNIFEGYQAGISNTTGANNAFLGYLAGYSNTTGLTNAFLGYQAGYTNQTGNYNTFLGNQAGASNLAGSSNTFVGTQAGFGFGSGNNNTYLGVGAGWTFQNGSYNVFIGSGAGAGYNFPNGATGGQNNVIVGTNAGFYLNTGYNNVMLGNYSGFANSSGNNNIFMGFKSGYTNSTGNYNVFLGYQSGLSNTQGFNNTFLGYQAGYTNSTGNWNVFIGNNTGYLNTTGVQNVFIGDGSGYKNSSGSQNTFVGLQSGNANTLGTGNAFFGWNAGLLNSTGADNAFFGLGAGYNNTTAYYNTFIGFSAGLLTSTGQFNTYIGSNAGRANPLGASNVVVGESASYSTTSGSNNTIIGNTAGYNLVTGSGNVFIGSGSAANETSTSNKLFIENSAGDYTSSLIYGDFGTGYLRLNASVDVKNSINFPNQGAVIYEAGKEALWFNGTYFSWGFGGTYNYFGRPVTIGNTANPAYMLYVNGNAWSTGSWGGSDIRWKKELKPLEELIPSILQLNGYRFNWRKEEFPDMNFDETTQIGLIAQDVEKIFPELVKTDKNGFKAVSYEKLSVILLEGVKEQEKKIDSIAKQNEELRSDLQTLKEEVQVLKTQAGLNNK